MQNTFVAELPTAVNEAEKALETETVTASVIRVSENQPELSEVAKVAEESNA